MTEETEGLGRPRAFETIFYGWLAVGILDMLDAYFFFGFYYNISFFRVFQGVSAGLLGREAAVTGGVQTGLLGLALHYVVAFGVAGMFYLLCTRLKFLYRQPRIWGPVYGIGVHFFMQCVVVPLSAIGKYPTFLLDWPLVNNIVGHALLVGLPIALIARWSATRHRTV